MMKVVPKRFTRKNLRDRRRTKGCTFVLKSEFRGRKKKKVVNSWNNLCDKEAQVSVRLISEPFRPNAATREAQQLNHSISRFAVH